MRVKALRGMSVVVAALLAVATLTVVSAGSANAATYATPDVGQVFKGGSHHPGKVYAYSWRFQGKRNYWCMFFSGHASDGTTSQKITGRIPGYTVANSAAAKKLVNSYAEHPTRSNRLTAERAWAVWFLSSDRNLRADKPFYVHQLKARGEYSGVESLISWAKAHDPYKASVSASQLQVGQSGTVTVKVLASNGKAASKLPVTISSPTGNVKLSSTSHATAANGTVRLPYTRTGVGTVRLVAHGTAPSSYAVMMTNASPGRQRLLSGGFESHFSASYNYSKSPSGPAMTTSCTTQCNGVATVTWTKGVESGSVSMRLEYYTGNTKVAQCDAAAGHNCTATAKLADATIWTSYRYCYLNKVGGSCTTSWVTVKEHKEVICPPWVQWTIKCPCGGDTVLTLTAPSSNKRFDTATVTYGSTSKTVSLVNGTPQDVSLTGYKSGQQIAASFTAYRDSGHTQALKTQELFSGLKLG